jgi:uncharacterized protein YjiS (DUF1127 family)
MFARGIVSRIFSWRRYHSNLRELSQLTERELKDVGVSRSNLEYAARLDIRSDRHIRQMSEC